MRHTLRIIFSITFIALIGLSSGCGGPTDEELQYDAKVSEQKREEYAEQMKKSMEEAKKKAMQGGGPGGPYKRR